MQDNIGVVISKGLADTFEKKPKNPIEHFAKWLLNFRQAQREADNVSGSIFQTVTFRPCKRRKRSSESGRSTAQSSRQRLIGSRKLSRRNKT